MLLDWNSRDYVRDRRLEEYADAQMAEGVGPIVLERFVKPNILGQPTDENRLAQLLPVASERWFGEPTSASGQAIPCVMDYLESQIPADGDSALARFGIADIAIGAHLGWLEAADFTIDARRWPRTARTSARCSIGRRSRRPPRRSEEPRMP